jgi:hypothetical protein
LGRRNADTLADLPGQSPYNLARPLFGRRNFERDGQDPETQQKGILVLSALGFQLDIVDKPEYPTIGGTLPKAWLASKYTGSAANKINELFWRTMVVGKNPEGKNLQRACSFKKHGEKKRGAHHRRSAYIRW